MITAKEIAKFLGKPLIGNDLIIKGPSSIYHPQKNTYLFMMPGMQHNKTMCSEILVLATHQAKVDDFVSWIIVEDPRLAFAKIGNQFFTPRQKPETIMASIISPNVKLGSNVQIGSGCIIYDTVEIGEGTVIRDYVIIRPKVTIGMNCLIKSHAVIGEEGFGFAFDTDGKPVKMPHSGGVRLGDRVEIGAGAIIKSGTLDYTRLDDDVKINDGVSISHNVLIGPNTMVAGGQIGGSAVIGKGVWIGMGVFVRNKVKVGDHAILGMGSVVVKDVETKTVVTGNPAKTVRLRREGEFGFKS